MTKHSLTSQYMTKNICSLGCTYTIVTAMPQRINNKIELLNLNRTTYTYNSFKRITMKSFESQ